MWWDTLIDAVKSVWMVVSNVGKAIWGIITSSWQMLGMMWAIGIVLLTQIVGIFSWLVTQLEATWDVLTASDTALTTALNAGWPPALAEGFTFINAYVPLGELTGMVAALCSTFIVCTVIRVVKSPLPVIGK